MQQAAGRGETAGKNATFFSFFARLLIGGCANTKCRRRRVSVSDDEDCREVGRGVMDDTAQG
jgi:hypothetical protein